MDKCSHNEGGRETVMKLIKQGGHHLFEQDPETARIVAEMLVNLEKHGMDAVRRYSQKLDDWDPSSL